MTVIAFIAKHWRALILGVGVASLALVAILARADARQCHKRDAQHVAERDVEIAKNAVNLASIADLEAALKAKEADSAARADAFNGSKVQNAASVATADARRAADNSRVDTLRTMATTLPTSPDCTAPSALLNNLKGL
jgi:hypothetical protein